MPRVAPWEWSAGGAKARIARRINGRKSARRQKPFVRGSIDERWSAGVQLSYIARVGLATAAVTATSSVTLPTVRKISGTISTATSKASGAIGTPSAIAIGAIELM